MNIEVQSGDVAASDSAGYFPVLTTLAWSPTAIRKLSTLAVLSFLAGREGDQEHDWRADALDALPAVFKTSAGVDKALDTVAAAFHAGQIERSAAPSERAFAVARAHATIYADEVEFPDDAHRDAIERAAGRVAYKLAERHQITDAEAAWCALKAFEEKGLRPGKLAATWLIDRAAAGRAEREAEGRSAAEREAVQAGATAAALASVFGAGE